jgi:hypothetical protein
MTEDVTLPCDQALLAATLALMSAYASPTPLAHVDTATQQRLMARKIVSNLFFLREHPALGDGMRRVVTTVHRHWVALAERLDVSQTARHCAGGADARPDEETLRLH